MKRHYPSSLRPILILLILVIGPLHAQTMFACEMMGKVMLDECCCEVLQALKDGVNSDCADVVDDGKDPCCEQSVQVSVDQEARQDTPIVKPLQLPSDVDPPNTIVALFSMPVEPLLLACPGEIHSSTVAGQTGSDTYLITQRLRI